MSWVSTMGRRVLQAYTEGLAMTCPLHRAGDILEQAGDMLPTDGMAAAINRSQDDVRASLRPEFAGAFQAQTISSVRH